MSIKATFPAGLTETTVNGLHQWDYGQQLEVECPDLPALVEVHFACAGMSEAVVRSCSVSATGVLTAAIPDRCLEQTTPIYAWVVVLGATSGTTVLKITMPIIKRTRPEARESVPEEVCDKYTESIAAINAQIESLKAGDVTVSNANRATSASFADVANKALKADEATVANMANYVAESVKADILQGTAAQARVVADCNTVSYNALYGGFYTRVPGIYMVVYLLANSVKVSAIIAILSDSEDAVGTTVRNSDAFYPVVYDIPLGCDRRVIRLADIPSSLSSSPVACYALAKF